MKVGDKIQIPTNYESSEEKGLVALSDSQIKLSTNKEVHQNFNKDNVGNLDSSVYIVQKGDTLIGISKKTGLSIDKILKLNNWTRDKVLKVGEKIKLK